MLIDAGASPLRLQRWMGHHSAAFTLDTYGHLLREDLGPHLDLGLGDSMTDGRPVGLGRPDHHERLRASNSSAGTNEARNQRCPAGV